MKLVSRHPRGMDQKNAPATLQAPSTDTLISIFGKCGYNKNPSFIALQLPTICLASSDSKARVVAQGAPAQISLEKTSLEILKTHLDTVLCSLL